MSELPQPDVSHIKKGEMILYCMTCMIDVPVTIKPSYRDGDRILADCEDAVGHKVARFVHDPPYGWKLDGLFYGER